jgi:tRNA-splicing ligase RtcB
MEILERSEAIGILPVEDRDKRPITVIGTRTIREGLDAACLEQARNSAGGPGVHRFVLNPDAHIGHGAPIGSVLASPSHIYPGPVGVDIKCSMSLLQTDLPIGEIQDRSVRRALINAICERIPTGPGRGQRTVKKPRHVDVATGKRALIEGASKQVCETLGIPAAWAVRCEDSHHLGHDGTQDALAERLETLIEAGTIRNFADKVGQLGSYGGGNHFGECENVEFASGAESAAEAFGMKRNYAAFLSHCGSRGLGNILAQNQFRVLQSQFEKRDTPFPGGDKHLVYAALGTPEADAYIDDMALGANFATVNHLLINALVLEAFQEVFPGTQGWLVYFISHNIARKEIVDGTEMWVHRKGATRAFPRGHEALKETPFFETGHPILLPGNPVAGSVVMAAEPGAEISCFSVNHGAGRTLGRKNAIRTLDQRAVDAELLDNDVLSNCRAYPLDEAPAAYKDFAEVVRSVELAGLAKPVAHLKAKFVIKDAGAADD